MPSKRENQEVIIKKLETIEKEVTDLKKLLIKSIKTGRLLKKLSLFNDYADFFLRA